MRQTTLLFFVRLYLYKLSLSKSKDEAVYRRDHAKRARQEERPVVARAPALSPQGAAAALAAARAARAAAPHRPQQVAAQVTDAALANGAAAAADPAAVE